MIVATSGTATLWSPADNARRRMAAVNAAATGRASIEQLRELSAISIRQLVEDRKRYLRDNRHRPQLVVPTVRLVRTLHASIHLFLSRFPASHETTHPDLS